MLALDFRFHPRHVVLHVWDGTDAFPVPPTYTNLHAPPPPGPSHRGRPPQQQQSRQQETGEVPDMNHLDQQLEAVCYLLCLPVP